MLPNCKRPHRGVALSHNFVDGRVVELAEAVLLVDLNNCQWSGEELSMPHVFSKEVGKGDCLGAASDTSNPLS